MGSMMQHGSADASYIISGIVMMLAMMVPSIAPVLWRHHRALANARVASAGRCTTALALGYASVWGTIGVALDAAGADRHFAPWVAGVVVLAAGALQCTPWKANSLARCREAFAPAVSESESMLTAWRNGIRLGIRCAMSCAAPTAVLFVVGLMDLRAMLAATAVISAERLAPTGPRIARWTGALTVAAGLLIWARAF